MKSLHSHFWAITAEAYADYEAMTGVIDMDAGERAGMTWDEYCCGLADAKFQARFDAGAGLLMLPICGVLRRGASGEAEAFCNMYDTKRIEQAARFAANDERVRGLAFVWDSPGGWCEGMEGTLVSLAELKMKRPELKVVSLVAGQACSLAYVFANEAGRIEAMSGATVGSIGVMQVTTDYSKALADAGIERRLFSDGIFKGMGAFGVAWKPEWYGMVEAGIKELSGMIRSRISSARPSLTEADMQGQTWEVGSAPAGMVDGITAEVEVEDWLETFARSL